MALATGARIGPYDVVDSLGAGGMGEVYRARDSRLGRDVALKVLPEVFANDAERLARFEREAQVLAALNHPHIAAIYGLEEAGGIRALVLELVEGDTLAERLERGAMPFDEALPIARQIVAALEAAHEQGIIHRDLKPSNVKITPGGTVKVLDFGLAKLGEPAVGSSGGSARPMASQSPTITSPAMMTGAGLILGTAAYMAPEQAKGRPADRKSDVWAFGCVLYEMLSGRRAFDGEDVSETMAAVIRADPDWSRLPASTPTYVRTLLRRCLQKDPRKRLPDIGVARLEFDEEHHEIASTPAPAAPVRSWWRRALPAVVSAILAGVVTGFVVGTFNEDDSPVARFSLSGIDGVSGFSSMNLPVLSLSSDGSRLVYSANSQLYLRQRDEFEVRPIPGTQDRVAVLSPVFSPDGNQIAFISAGDRVIKKIAATGGVAVPVTTIQLTGAPLGLSWGVDDTLLFVEAGGGIMKVSANGGKPEPLVRIEAGEAMYGPQMLPGGRDVLFTLGGGDAFTRWDQARIVVQSLSSGERTTLVEGGSDGRYVPSGHIVYAVRGTLFAVPFDPERRRTTGRAVPVVQGVRRSPLQVGTAVAHFTASADGSLAYLPGPALASSASRELFVIDPKGSRQPLKVPPGQYETPRISPDESRVAVSSEDGVVSVYEMGTRTMRKLTLVGRNRFPIWIGNERIAFQSDREGDLGIFWQRADGADTAERLTKAEAGTAHVPESSLRDEAFSYSVVEEKSGSASLWIRRMAEKKSTPLGNIKSSRLLNSEFSPDGRYLAYTLRVDGASVRVEPFPPTGAASQVSVNDTGHHPLWSRDGTRLMYFPGAGQLVSVAVNTKSVFTFGNPTPVTGGWRANVTPEGSRNHDIFRDGRFISADVPQPTNEGGASEFYEIRVVLNWFEELKRLAPPDP